MSIDAYKAVVIAVSVFVALVVPLTVPHIRYIRRERELARAVEKWLKKETAKND